MILQLTIDDALWAYAVAATAQQTKNSGSTVDPVAQATQVVNDYCRACGDQMGLSGNAKLAVKIAALDDAGKAALADSIAAPVKAVAG